MRSSPSVLRIMVGQVASFDLKLNPTLEKNHLHQFLPYLFKAVDIAENKLSPLGGPSLASSETLEAKKIIVNPSLEHHVIGETLVCNTGLHSDVITDMNGDLHSSTGKSAGEGTDLFFGLKSLYEFYSQTPMVTAESTYPENVDLSVQMGKEGPFIPVVSPLDDSSVRVSNTSSSYVCPEVCNVQDPLTCEEVCGSSSDGGFRVTNRRLEIEEAEAVPCLETLDNLFEFTTQSGQRSGKFQPKPKARIDREKCDAASTSHPDENEMKNHRILWKRISQMLSTRKNASRLFLKFLKRSKQQLRERINTCNLVDEAQDEGNFTTGCSPSSLIAEYDNDCDEYQAPNKSRSRKEPRTSNKFARQKEKPVRKRKKSNEVPDHAGKEPLKKFSHSTRRKRRQEIDKVLLEANWDDIVRQKLPIRDIILLAEYKERMPLNSILGYLIIYGGLHLVLLCRAKGEKHQKFL
ncbi:hypothetical protein Acr_08g0013830 [Actinidia rufa]|uniref:Uncharacterized protein n=1 Tax=Actinidia rufa TaxID=165716 RepID=A0A7J0F4X9_9ERIC|nr:hypothetical protein Acr_08g0013830 [Actinidia rufa]